MHSLFRLSGFLLIAMSSYAQFDSVSHLVAYATLLPEYPSMDVTDWEHPDFSSFYESRKPTMFGRIKNFFGFGQTSINGDLFQKSLQAVTDTRKKLGMQGSFVQKISFNTQGRLIVFGDVQGAFHSLVRSLAYLEKIEIISEKLIIDEDSYFIFNGNLINGSPYNLETLNLVITLMEKNPDRVFYIAGAHERELHEVSNLCRQIKIELQDEEEVICSDIKKFFDTLPQAIYVKRGEDASLKIYADAALEPQDVQLGSFLGKDDRRFLLSLDAASPKIEKVLGTVNAIVRGHDYSRTEGLRRHLQDPIVWTVFSSPNSANTRLYGFFKDAFAVIDSAVHFHDWTVTLYARDIEKKTDFDEVGTYNLFTGLYVAGRAIDFFDTANMQKLEKELAQKRKKLVQLKEVCRQGKKGNGESELATEKQLLLVGTSVDLSRGSKNIGTKIKETLTKIFDEKNKAGGVRGVTFQNIILDDAYTPSVARQNFLKFAREMNTQVLLAPYGTATLQESLDLVNDDKMAIFFPVATDSSVFRKSILKNVINLTASYFEQGKALIDYVFKAYKPRKIALFYQNDDFGKDGLNGAKKALSDHKFRSIIEVPYERNQADFAEQAKRIQQENPDVIGFFSVPLAALDLLKTLGADFLSRRVLFSIADLRDEEVLQFINAKGLSLIYANTLPDRQSLDFPIAQEYQLFAQEQGINESGVSFETYVAAELFFHLIGQVEGTVTKEKLLAAAQKIKGLDFKGLRLDFDPETRVLLDSLWISTDSNEPWKRVVLRDVVLQETTSAPEESIVDEKKERLIFSVGTSLDLSKSLKKPNSIIKNTLTQVFEETNKAGGINDVMVRDVFFDDAYVPAQAKQNYLRLLNDMQIDTVFGSRGTPTTQELLEFIKDGRMALIFPIATAASILRNASLKNIINLTASYYEQGKAVTKVVLGQLKSPKVALFYQDDNFGSDVLEGAKDVLKKAGITDFLEVPYKRGQLEFEKQVAAIKKENPNAIGLFGTTLPAVELIKSLGSSALRDKIFFGSEVLREQEFFKFMKDKGLSFVYASSLPDPTSRDLPIAVEYQEFVKQYDLELDSFGFEAYVAARIFLNLIGSIDLPITKEKIIAAAEKMIDVDFKGIQLSFNPKTRVLLNSMWVGKNNGEPWIKLSLEENNLTQEVMQKEVPDKPQQSEKPHQNAQNIVNPLHGEALILGCTLDTTKGLQAMTSPLKSGMNAAIQEINSRGGVQGIKLKIIYLDDGYVPEVARKNVDIFLQEYGTNLFIGSVGTPTLEAYLDMIKDKKIALFFPFTGASIFRQAAYENLLFFAPSYDVTTVAATEYILKNNNHKRWALLYQDDAFGKPPKDAVKKVLENVSTEKVLEVPFERNNVNFEEQLKKIRAFNPDVIAFFSPAIAAQSFITAIGVDALAGKILYGLYWLSGNKLEAFLKERGVKMILPSIVPDPATSSLPIANNFRKAVGDDPSLYDVNALEGYINVRILAHLLEKIDAPITIEKIMQAASAIKNYDFEGLNLSFEPARRELSHEMWLNLSDGKEWKQINLRQEDFHE